MVNNISLLLALFFFTSTSSFAQVQKINNLDKQEVTNIYQQYFCESDKISSGWNGDIIRGRSGALSDQYQQAVLDRVYFIRLLAGLDNNIELSGTLSRRAQRAALLLSANRELRTGGYQMAELDERVISLLKQKYQTNNEARFLVHYYPNYLSDFQNSLLVHGTTLSHGLINYFRHDDDVDNNNYAAIDTVRPQFEFFKLLAPELHAIGVGSVELAQVHKIGFTDELKAGNTGVLMLGASSTGLQASNAEFSPILWPPAGYVPYPLVGRTWSAKIPGADLRAAYVSVKSSSNHPYAYMRTKLHSFEANDPVDFLSWDFQTNEQLGEIVNLNGSFDDRVVEVTIGNILFNGSYRDFTYKVIDYNPYPGFGNSRFELSFPQKVEGEYAQFLQYKLFNGQNCLMYNQGKAASTSLLQVVLQYSQNPEGPFRNTSYSSAFPYNEFHSQFDDGFYRLSLISRVTSTATQAIVNDPGTVHAQSEVLHYNSNFGFRRLDEEFQPAANFRDLDSAKESIIEQQIIKYPDGSQNSNSEGEGYSDNNSSCNGQHSQIKNKDRLLKRYKRLKKKKRSCRKKKKTNQCTDSACQSKCRSIRSKFKRIRQKVICHGVLQGKLLYSEIM